MTDYTYSEAPAPGSHYQSHRTAGRGRDQRTVYVLDSAGVIIDTNEVVAPLTNHPPEDLIGTDFRDYLDPVSAKAVAAILGECNHIEFYVLEAMIRDRDGIEKPIRGQMVPLLDEEEALVGFVIHLERLPRHIGLLSAAEAELRDADLLDLISDAVIEVRHDLVITTMNRAGQDLFSYNAYDLEEGICVLQLFDQASAETVTSAIEKTLAGRKSKPNAFLFSRKDATCFYGEMRISPLIEGGSIKGFCAVISDLTFNLEAERASRLFRSLVASSIQPIALANAAGGIEIANRPFASLFGYNSPDDLKGFRIDALVAPESAAEAFRPGKEAAMVRARGIKRHGTMFNVNLRIQNLVDDAGREQGMIYYAGQDLDAARDKA